MKTILRRLCNGFINTAILANMAGTAVIFILVLIINFDVASRNLFNAPFQGAVEIVIFSLILIVFLQLPDVVRSNRLTRSDGFLGLLSDKKPALASILMRFVDLTAAIFMGLITYAIWPSFVEDFGSCHFFTAPEFGPAFTGEVWTDVKAAMARCSYFGTPGILTAPWWPAKLAVTFGVGLSAIIFALKAIMGGHQAELVHLQDTQT